MNEARMKIDRETQCSKPVVWVTKTSRTGDTNARIGIAEHLGGIIFEIDVPTEFCIAEQVREKLLEAALVNINGKGWPDVLIGPCFHIPYMQIIKRLSKNKSVVVALRPPVRGLEIKAGKDDVNNTDVIVSYPYHNNVDIPNILICETIANRVSDDLLHKEKLRWADNFSQFIGRGPVIGLLMGGDIGDGRRVFLASIATKLSEEVNQLANVIGGSVIASVSARTSNACKLALMSKITVPYYLYDPKQDTGDNPYFAILSTADYIVVTADSISMCCEAVSSGAPVYIFYDGEIVENSHMEIVSYLLKKRYVRLLGDDIELEKFTYQSINSAKIVAERVRHILSERKIRETC